MEPRRTSHSEVESYLKCERRHYYSYGLEIQEKHTNENLERGILVHHGLAEYYLALKEGYGHDRGVTAAINALSGLYQTSTAYDPTKLYTQALALLGWYFDHYKDEAEEIEVLEVETDYLIALTDDYSLPVKVDLIYRYMSSQKIVVADHKVLGDFYTQDDADLKPQLPKYMAGLLTNKMNVDQLEYNQLRHRNTNDNKADPGLRFVRLPVEVTAARVRRTAEEQIRAANRISRLRSMSLSEWSKSVLRNPDACRGCPFKMICTADLNGRPTEDLIEFEYRPKTKRNEMNN